MDTNGVSFGDTARGSFVNRVHLQKQTLSLVLMTKTHGLQPLFGHIITYYYVRSISIATIFVEILTASILDTTVLGHRWCGFVFLSARLVRQVMGDNEKFNTVAVFPW